MSNASLKQNDYSKIKWVQTNCMTAPGECMDILSSLKSTDPYILANKNNLFGIVFFYKNEYFEAQGYLNKALEISKQHKFHKIETKALINLCSVYLCTQRYNLALEYGFESLKYKFDHLNSMAYNNLARIYAHLGNTEKQFEFQNKAKSLNEKAGEKRFVVLDLFNIAEFYSKQGMFKKAFSTIEESLGIIIKHKINMLLPYAHSQMAIFHFELEQYEQALYHSDRALEFNTKYKTNDSADAAFAKAKVLNHYKQYNEALELLDSVLNDIKIEQDYTDAYELKIEIESKHKPERLVDTYRNYIKLLKSNPNKQEDKNELTNILKFKEKEIEEIQKRNEAIELQNKELEVVSKLLAHDLKTPIRTIGSFVNLIKNKLKINNDPEINEYIEYVSTGTQDIYKKMNATEKFLNFKLAKDKAPFNLASALDPLILKFNSDNHNINITSDKELSVYGDIMAVKRMFDYLFRFIIKHSKEDQIEINIRHESNGTDHLFFITDNENTMQYAKYWFEDMLSSDLLKTGKVDIGFAFVRKIINLHHGHLLIDEEDGKPFLKIWLPVDNG